MTQNLTVEKNDPRLCIAGTENLWSVCRRQECGNVTVSDVIAENIEHSDALLFAAAPDMLKALLLLVDQYDSSDDFTMGGNLTNEPFLMARAAIAKATGRGDA